MCSSALYTEVPPKLSFMSEQLFWKAATWGVEGWLDKILTDLSIYNTINWLICFCIIALGQKQTF